MKVNDLMDKEQMNAAYEAGKRLAKMVGNINLAPKKEPIKKVSFGDFFQKTLPQSLSESDFEMKDEFNPKWMPNMADEDHARRKRKALTHQLDILLDKLRKYENQELVSIKQNRIPGAWSEDMLTYVLGIRNEDRPRVRYVYLLTDNTNLNKHITGIVARINHIFELGGVYY